jgi:lipocalin
MENAYTPLDQNYCVSAQYKIKDSRSFWGYQIDVFNFAQNEAGQTSGGNLCANYNEEMPSQLNVAPCFIPQFWSGPYWVVAYNETAGYALVSGGQPDEVVPGETGCGGSGDDGSDVSTSSSSSACCRTGTGINGSGLWIFSRSRVRDEPLISTVRKIARDAGFATSVLFDVNQTSCEALGTGSSNRRGNLRR